MCWPASYVLSCKLYGWSSPVLDQLSDGVRCRCAQWVCRWGLGWSTQPRLQLPHSIASTTTNTAFITSGLEVSHVQFFRSITPFMGPLHQTVRPDQDRPGQARPGQALACQPRLYQAIPCHTFARPCHPEKCKTELLVG